MAFVEDLDTFLNPDEFADAATLDGEDVFGIFDGAYISPLDVSSSGPAFTLKTASVSGDPIGTALVITTGLGEGTYKVVENEPDGTGMTILKLEVQ